MHVTSPILLSYYLQALFILHLLLIYYLLHCATIDVVQLLLEYGAQPDSHDEDGITAVMYACYHGHSGAVEVLLNWGADVSRRNKAGQNSYQLAVNAGFDETARMILHGPTILVTIY